jgi:hypothetical protein
VHKDVQADKVLEKAKRAYNVLAVVDLMEGRVDMAYPITLSTNLNVSILLRSLTILKRRRGTRAQVELVELKMHNLEVPAVVLFGSPLQELWLSIKANFSHKDKMANQAKI